MLLLLSPVTLTLPPVKLNASSAAALDQSPSTVFSPASYLCPPRTVKMFGSGSLISMPNERRTPSVISIYALLSTGGRTFITLSPESVGSANSRPDTN